MTQNRTNVAKSRFESSFKFQSLNFEISEIWVKFWIFFLKSIPGGSWKHEKYKWPGSSILYGPPGPLAEGTREDHPKDVEHRASNGECRNIRKDDQKRFQAPAGSRGPDMSHKRRKINKFPRCHQTREWRNKCCIVLYLLGKGYLWPQEAVFRILHLLAEICGGSGPSRWPLVTKLVRLQIRRQEPKQAFYGLW